VADARVSQVVVESAGGHDADARASQVVVEAVGDHSVDARVSQVVVEVVSTVPPPRRNVPYEITINGAITAIQLGWNIRATANGRSVMSCAVVSEAGSYRPALDDIVILYESTVIVSSSVANPSIVTTSTPHGLVNGMTIEISGHTGSTPSINAEHVATVISPTTFSIPVNVSVGGVNGSAARRLFGGRVTRTLESAAGEPGLLPIKTALDVSSYDAQADRRVVHATLTAGTLESMLVTLAAACGFTLSTVQPTGPTLADDIVCDYETLRSVLDKLTALTGYTWEWDEWEVLIMTSPASVVCPFSIVDNSSPAIGDVTVERTRNNYANRVILRYSSTATAAWGYLFTDGSTNVAHTDTVTVGGMTYQWRTTLTNVAGYLQLGADIGASLDALHRAITLTGTPGTDYALATTINTVVTASRTTGRLDVVALTAGSSGNSIAVSSASSGTIQAVWGWEGFSWGGTPITALFGGSDVALTGVATANNAGEQGSHGIWETVISAPEVNDAGVAAALAAAYLAERIVTAATVAYATYAYGLRPGQTQTVTMSYRGINGTYLVTDVQHRSQEGLAIRNATVIDSATLGSVARWRDTYKQWGKA
jgi:hypothetical protein